MRGIRTLLIGTVAVMALAACQQEETTTQAPASSSQSSQNYTPPDYTDDETAPAETTTSDEFASNETTTTAPAPRRRRPAPAATPAPSVAVEPVPLLPADQQVDEETVTVIGRRAPQWAQRPTRRQLESSYPERALERGVEGEALLSCAVREDQRLACTTESERPGNYGFGAAGQRVLRYMRVAEGEPAVGETLRIRVLFRVPNGRRNDGRRPL